MNSYAILLALAGMSALYFANRSLGAKLLLAEIEDEDIKIASGPFSARSSGEDISELAARDFLMEKRAGNIERARELGIQFAQAILDTKAGPLVREMVHKPQQVQHHQYLLFSYVVNRVIAEQSPNGILAQTSLNVFYSEVEEKSPDVYKHISDMAAFSLYILCERSKCRSDEEIGQVFAQLCGGESDSTLMDYGNRLYRKLYDSCMEIIGHTPYSDVE